MKLKQCRTEFLRAGYAPSDYVEAIEVYGRQAEVWVTLDEIIVDNSKCNEVICYPVLQKDPSVPPVDAQFLFYLLISPENCDALVGDLEERYRLIRKKFGKRRADFWYWKEAIRSVGPIVWAWAKKALMKPATAVVAWAVARGLLGHDSWAAALVELWKRIRS